MGSADTRSIPSGPSSSATYSDLAAVPLKESTPTLRMSRSPSRLRSMSTTPSNGWWIDEAARSSCMSFSSPKSDVNPERSSFAFVDCANP